MLNIFTFEPSTPPPLPPVFNWWGTVKQKLDYIHNNPVKAGFVTRPEDWKYSSARNYQDDHTVMEIDAIGFFG